MTSWEMYKMCLKKKTYPTWEAACKVAEKVFLERGVKLRVYFCPLCHKYHLTSRLEEKIQK